MNRVASQDFPSHDHHWADASFIRRDRPPEINRNRTESNKPGRPGHPDPDAGAPGPHSLSRPEPGWTRLNDPERSDHMISRKTLEIRPVRSACENFRQPPEHPDRCTSPPNQLLVSRPQPGWTRLNDPERSEHSISRKTLEIRPVRSACENFRQPPEHPRFSPASTADALPAESVRQLHRTGTPKSGIVETVASGGASDCEGHGWLRIRLP
jgi:hypothetical protein